MGYWSAAHLCTCAKAGDPEPEVAVGGSTLAVCFPRRGRKAANEGVAAVGNRVGNVGNAVEEYADIEQIVMDSLRDEISNGTRITIERTAVKSIAQGRNAGALNGALNGALKVSDPLNAPLNGILPEGIILYVSANPGANRKVLAAKLEVSPRNLDRAISALVAQKRIERRGSKKTGGYYIVTEAEG